MASPSMWRGRHVARFLVTSAGSASVAAGLRFVKSMAAWFGRCAPRISGPLQHPGVRSLEVATSRSIAEPDGLLALIRREASREPRQPANL